jgi:hypothetical protein
MPNSQLALLPGTASTAKPNGFILEYYCKNGNIYTGHKETI